jgi:hypothetical protein
MAELAPESSNCPKGLVFMISGETIAFTYLHYDPQVRQRTMEIVKYEHMIRLS